MLSLVVRKIGIGGVASSLGASLVASSAQAASAMPKIDFVDPVAGAGMAQGGHDLSPVGMFLAADLVVQAVIILLLLASVVTWTIGLMKWLELRGARHRLAKAMGGLLRARTIASVGDTGFAPISDMIVSAEDEIAASGDEIVTGEGVKDRVALRLSRLEAALRRRAGRGVGILAIVGSSAPFVGLFGTVWGIMNSFIGIAESQTTNLAVVAPGIAEALLTTAMGLVAAIPAGIMYNIFARGLTTYVGELGDAGAAVLILAAREVDRAETRG